jgi:hypothetical protein
VALSVCSDDQDCSAKPKHQLLRSETFCTLRALILKAASAPVGTSGEHAMHSHELVTRYQVVPTTLRDNLVGTSYLLPEFEDQDLELLKGFRVALVTTHGSELPEFHVPLHYLRESMVEPFSDVRSYRRIAGPSDTD